MAKFRYINDLLKEQPRQCAHPGCTSEGTHRAPISPERPNEFQYFCLEHVQEFNKRWDFFHEKSQEEIESFQKSSFTGHRPTWKIGSDPLHSSEKLYEAFGRFMGEAPASQGNNGAYKPPITAKQRRALEQLDLEHPSSEEEVKKRYKKLARQLHPDKNPGNKQAEERFKQVNVAYRYLIDHYCAHIV